MVEGATIQGQSEQLAGRIRGGIVRGAGAHEGLGQAGRDTTCRGDAKLLKKFTSLTREVPV